MRTGRCSARDDEIHSIARDSNGIARDGMPSQNPHAAGAGLVRCNAIDPCRPLFAPDVNVYESVAELQVANVMLAVPTGVVVTVAGPLNTPPLDA